MKKMFFAKKKDAKAYMATRKSKKKPEDLKAVKAYRDGRTKVEGYVLQDGLRCVREDGKLS